MAGEADSGTPKALETLEGTLTRIVFQNESSYWTVARLTPEPPAPSGGGAASGKADATGQTQIDVKAERGDSAASAKRSRGQVTIVGTLLSVPEGTPLVLRGTWVKDPKYGRQFEFESYQTRSPVTLVGIERFLASGVIPGIRAALAKRMVARFGVDTFEVIKSSPERLQEVSGIGAARAKSIAEAWQDQRELENVMVFLHGYGVSAAYAVRIYRRYGRDAIKVIRQNPYRLALDIWGIGFKIADGIARNLGIEATAVARLEAGLIHVLGDLGEDGHLHAPEPVLIQRAAALLEVDPALLGEPLDNLERSHLVVRESLGDRGRCVSLHAMWDHEDAAAQALAALAVTSMKPMKVDLAGAVSWFEGEAKIELAPQQRRAIEAAAMDKCTVITGGPGVGKTTIVRAIVSIFHTQERRLALAAPTGRAAKRLSESTRAEAVTVHRLLEYQPQPGAGFMRNASRPLEVDAVIVDEASMMDIALFRALLDALPAAAQLVLVGDVDQLPSVGPGSVLADVIASGAATVVRLTEIFRQARTSQIITAAHQVNRGEVPNLRPPPGDDARRSDFYFVPRSDPIAAREMIVDMVANRIPRRFGFDRVVDVQVMCPMHRGELGTIALNAALQEALNPPAPGRVEIERGDRIYRVGDKVMQIRNDYEKAVFNGDIGVILGIGAFSPEAREQAEGEGGDEGATADNRRGDSDRRGVDKKSELLVDFGDDRNAVYARADLDQLVHAYAVSVHKSQGSEYPATVLGLVDAHHVMLERNLLYTALTRGKQLVVVVGSGRAVAKATRNATNRQRWTWLAPRVQSYMEDASDLDDADDDADDKR